MAAYTYILKCSDKSYYTGCTSDLKLRIAQHHYAHFPECYTVTRLPVTLVFVQEFSDIQEAISAERQIKGWSRKKKEALIQSNFLNLKKYAQCQNETSYLMK